MAPQGRARVGDLVGVLEDKDCGLPEVVVEFGRLLLGRIDGLDGKIKGLDRKLRNSAREHEETARLMTIPGGRVDHRLQAFAPPMESFRRGRDFSAWLGLVPRQHTTGGKPRLGRISKMGQRDLRRLLFTGAMAVVRHASRQGEITDLWLAGMLARKPKKVVEVALANRTARRLWAVTTRREPTGFAPRPDRATKGGISTEREAAGSSGRQDAGTANDRQRRDRKNQRVLMGL